MPLEDLKQIRNLGEKSAKQLLSIGIESRQQLAELGAVRAYFQLKQQFTVSLNFLYAIHTGLQDKSIYDISKDEKVALQADLDALEALESQSNAT